MIAVLCCSPKSIYHQFPGVVCFDKRRDCRTFEMDMPVVAHPPCRAWSAFCRHQAKPMEGEAELGLFCAEALRRCGGVLEHPAHSLLFSAAGLPLPGESDGELQTLEVWQGWWGSATRKRTWLCFSKVNAIPEIPFSLVRSGEKRRWQVLSKPQRSATPRAFAEWLVQAAKSSYATTC